MNKELIIKNYRTQTWIILLFANVIFGIIALYYSKKTNRKYEEGDIFQAQISSKQTKKFLIIGLLLGMFSYFLLGFSFFLGIKNRLILQEYEMEKSWTTLQSEFKSKLLLTKKFANDVNHNFDTKIEISDLELINEKSKRINFQKLTIENLDSLKSFNKQIEYSLHRFSAVQKNISNMQFFIFFENFQNQCNAIENNITYASKDFYDKSVSYNSSIKKFPSNIIAKVLGLKPVGSF